MQGQHLREREARWNQRAHLWAIAGAALGCISHEPLPADSRFWAVADLLITSYTGPTRGGGIGHYGLFSANLRRSLADQPLESLVDKQSLLTTSVLQFCYR
jgi:phosphoglycerate dehydrogenase-like enzyme